MPKVNVKRVFLSLLVICMSSASAVADRPPIHWLSGGHTWVVLQGETFEFEARFISDVAIEDAYLATTGSMLPFFGHTGHYAPLGDFEANKVSKIKYRIDVRQDMRPGLHVGTIFVFVEKRPGFNKIIPQVLHVTIYVVEDSP